MVGIPNHHKLSFARRVKFTKSNFLHLMLSSEPSSSPWDVKASNKSSTTIYVNWSPIPKQFIHGILLGYHVHYTNLDPNGYEDVITRTYPTDPTRTWALITNLLKFTSYQIQVSAFTIKGDGPLSDTIFERTQEDGKK